MKSKVWILALSLVLVFLLGTTAFAAGDEIFLNMGSTSSTSGVYGWCVATASVVNKADNNIKVTVVESGASLDNLRRIRDGAFDFALCVDLPSAMQMYLGLDTFEGEKWDQIRWLFTRNIIADRLYARKDSGVKTFGDLKGKKFSPGIPGSASFSYIVKFNDLLKTKIGIVPASYGDAVNGLKEKKFVGLQKSSALDGIDSSLIEVNLKTPITVVGYSQDDIKKIRARYPYMNFIETPKGKIKQLPDAGPVWEEVAVVGAVAPASLSEEAGYQIVKAYVEGFEKVAQAYGAIRGWDPVEDYFKNVAPGGEVPVHAGLVRYAKEKGIEVPERFIPPEYKGK